MSSCSLNIGTAPKSAVCCSARLIVLDLRPRDNVSQLWAALATDRPQNRLYKFDVFKRCMKIFLFNYAYCVWQQCHIVDPYCHAPSVIVWGTLEILIDIDIDTDIITGALKIQDRKMKDHDVNEKGLWNERTSRKTIESCPAIGKPFEEQYSII